MTDKHSQFLRVCGQLPSEVPHLYPKQLLQSSLHAGTHEALLRHVLPATHSRCWPLPQSRLLHLL